MLFGSVGRCQILLEMNYFIYLWIIYGYLVGVYLPLLWEQSFCWKSPIALGYTRGHFSALVAMENDGYDNRGGAPTWTQTTMSRSLSCHWLTANESCCTFTFCQHKRWEQLCWHQNTLEHEYVWGLLALRLNSQCENIYIYTNGMSFYLRHHRWIK